MAVPDRLAAQDPISAVSTAELEELEREEILESDLYFNRETSWVRFNERVLELAEQDSTPLLERLKFAAIYANNLDEFFMVRVAGLHDQVDARITDPLADGRTPSETIDGIREKVVGHLRRLTSGLRNELLPQLAEHGVRIVGCGELTAEQRSRLRERFRRQIFPVLTPLAVGLARPFPSISTLSLSLAVLVRDPVSAATTFARVKVPKEMLDRFVDVDHGHVFVPLEQVIAENLEALFPGMEIVDHGFFRVTRDADFEVSDEADDLLRAVEAELRRRRFGEVVRVEVNAGMPPGLREQLVKALDVEEREVYDVDGLMDLADLWQIHKLPDLNELRDDPWTPVTQPRLQGEDDGHVDIFGAIRAGDVLVHHPYDSFATSVERFVQQAANDPEVLAIKMTVYRTSDDTPLVPALIR